LQSILKTKDIYDYTCMIWNDICYSMHQCIHFCVWFMVGTKTRKWAKHICHQMQKQYEKNLHFSWISEEVACPMAC
jgi:hypothetical protein